MKAIILAREKSGITEKKKSNALVRLCGLTLLERSLYTLKKAGIDEFLIVCGSQYSIIKNYIEKEKLSMDFNLSLFSEIDDIQLDDDHFLAVDINVLFEDNIIKSLMAKTDIKSIVCVDSSPKYIKEDSDSSKDFINTGIYLSNKRDLNILKNIFQNPFVSKQVIKESKIGIYDINGSFWYRINTQKDLKTAEDILLSKENPSFELDDFVSRFIRKIPAKFFVKYLVRTSVTPNHVSLLAFLLFISAALFFSIGKYNYNIIAGILVLLALVLDHTDGAIARLKFKTSRYGAWLDSMLDTIGFYSVIFGATIGLYIQTHDISSWITGMLVLFCQMVVFEDKHLSLYYFTEINAASLPTFKKENFFQRLLNVYRKRRLYFEWGVPVSLISIGAFLNIMLIIFLILIVAMSMPWLIKFIVYTKDRAKI